jgi:hypothetical protein
LHKFKNKLDQMSIEEILFVVFSFWVQL